MPIGEARGGRLGDLLLVVGELGEDARPRMLVRRVSCHRVFVVLRVEGTRRTFVYGAMDMAFEEMGETSLPRDCRAALSTLGSSSLVGDGDVGESLRPTREALVVEGRELRPSLHDVGDGFETFEVLLLVVVLHVATDEARLGCPVLAEGALMQRDEQMHLGDVTGRLPHFFVAETASVEVFEDGGWQTAIDPAGEAAIIPFGDLRGELEEIRLGHGVCVFSV